MPNWITNRLKIRGQNVKNVLKKLETETEDGDVLAMDFNKIIPMPDHIFKGNLGREEKEKYGKDNWYDWSIANWNTKWNSCASEVKVIEEDYAEVVFDTAWSPVVELMCKLAAQHPELEFVYEYAEEFLGNFTGRVEFKKGEITSDVQYEDDSREACELGLDLWGLKDEFKFNEDTQKYERIKAEEDE